MNPAWGVCDAGLLFSIPVIGRIAVADQGATELIAQHLFDMGSKQFEFKTPKLSNTK
jgi:hypothetical protein